VKPKKSYPQWVGPGVLRRSEVICDHGGGELRSLLAPVRVANGTKRGRLIAQIDLCPTCTSKFAPLLQEAKLFRQRSLGTAA
jgi:hypothetical protein